MAPFMQPHFLQKKTVSRRQKNADGTCAAAVVSASLSLAEQERRKDDAR